MEISNMSKAEIENFRKEWKEITDFLKKSGLDLKKIKIVGV